MFINIGIVEILLVLSVFYFIFGRKQMTSVSKKAGRKFMKFKKLNKDLNNELDEIKGVITSINKDSKK